MNAIVKSTKVELVDAEKIAEVLDSYECEGVLFLFDEAGKLEFVTDKAEGQEYGDDWPRAIKQDQVPRRETYPDDNTWRSAVWDVFDRDGDDGFVALLRELVPLLKSPLIILAGDYNESGLFFSAKVWSIQPGEKEVEILDIAVAH